MLGGYRVLGRLYRGVIEPTLTQYTWIGDPANVTDNEVFDPGAAPEPPPLGRPGAPDDRWVFTEENPARELQAAAGLAAAARVLKGYDDGLADGCRAAAEELWVATRGEAPFERTAAAVELFITTGFDRYRAWLKENREAVLARVDRTGWQLARVLGKIGDEELTAAAESALAAHAAELKRAALETPYGVPYRPAIWGAAWAIQRLGVELYFLHRAYPELFPRTMIFAALDFVLGCHPGANTASFVSGVGARSVTSAYAFHRAEGAFIPGGVVSGSALIRPDLVELLDFPYLWQQTEYVLGAGTADFLFLVLAADNLLSST